MAEFLSFLIWTLSVLTALATVLPFSRLHFGAVQGLAFPRVQWTLLATALLGAGLWTGLGWGHAALNIAVIAINAGFIARFTPLWPAQSARADAALCARDDARISILCANVKQSNRDYGRLIALAREVDPDVLIAIETDQPWVDALQELAPGFADHVEEARDTGYGMLLYSKLPLSEVEVADRVTRDVPSIKARVRLRDGRDLRLWAVHPEPPVIDRSTRGRNSEIALAGLDTAADPLPAIVAGDLNDVAWSWSTRQFQRISGLADPRVGRGFYSTFHAHYPFARWPLDHLFHDPAFRLIDMARGPKIGSDHFPILFTLALAETETKRDELRDASPEETSEIRDMIRAEKATDRGAIGTDWE